MSLEKKLSDASFFVAAFIALTGASLMGHAFNYIYTKAEKAVSTPNKNYSQPLNNPTNLPIYR